MNKVLSNSFVLFVLRSFLGIVFIIASIEKIAVPEVFAISVEAYQLVPIAFVNIFALIVPWMELICGVFLVAGIYPRASSILLSGLIGVFIVALLLALARGLNIDCGCFGPAHRTPVGWGKVLEDAGLLLIGLWIFAFNGQKTSAVLSSPVTE